MLEESTVNALKVMAYDQETTVEQIIIDAMREAMADPARWASITDRAKADSAVVPH